MIPLAAWFTRVFALRRFLLICAILFTIFSILCGLAHSLPEMVLGRVGQGFTGGAMIPTAQTIVATRLPRRQMPLGMTVFGLIVLLGPMFGPVAGGWLAENVSWHWCFFINLPVGLGLIVLLILGLPPERANYGLLKKGDWLGIAGFTVGLSALTIVLEEGQRERWFESNLIISLAAFATAGGIMLCIAQFTAPDPILKLRLLANRAFASVTFIVLVMGTIMYGVLYLIPQFLAIIAGYNAEQAGMIMLISGVPAFLLIPFLPRMMGRFNVKMMVGIGLTAVAVSCFLDAALTAQASGINFFYSQILRGFGQILATLPLNQAALAAVARDSTGDAAGIFNMARNLGGSIGLALIGVLIDRRTDMHSNMLSESVTSNSSLAWERIEALSSSMGLGDKVFGQLRVMSDISREITTQATVLTYADCFWLLGFATLAILPLIVLLRQPTGFMSVKR
jgi:MFS transporter, DHA2 family, multidrug resistance protein